MARSPRSRHRPPALLPRLPAECGQRSPRVHLCVRRVCVCRVSAHPNDFIFPDFIGDAPGSEWCHGQRCPAFLRQKDSGRPNAAVDGEGPPRGERLVSGKVRDRTAAARGPAHGGAKQLTGRETRRSMGPGGRERSRGTEARALSGDSCPRGSGSVCYRLYSSRVRPTLSARPLPPFMTYTGPGWLHSPWTEHRCLLTRLWGLLSEGLHVLKQGSFALTYIRL